MLKFLDLFSGIGGFRLGMKQAGHTCVGHCEIDKFANMSYAAIHKPREDEWFGTDITRVRTNELPTADCWCFGFPCQDISVAGKQKGFTGGKRSSLFFTVTGLIRNLKEENRPEYLFIENVKNLLSINGGVDFAKLLIELGEIGYDAEWQVLNSKDFGVPQNRERVFIIGHLRGRGTREVFPIGTTGQQTNIPVKIVAHRNGYRRNLQTFAPDGITEALDTGQGGGRGHHVLVEGNVFTLTTQDIHGVLLVKEATKRGHAEANIGDSINLSMPNSKTRRGRVGKRIANTLDTSCNQGVVIAKTIRVGGRSSPFESKQNWDTYKIEGRIRRLTPLECFRLQGFTDEQFYKAQAVNSDSQLYKQAGNSVTVNVIYEIAKRL